MRIFLGVFPPPPVQGALHAAAEPLRRAAASVSWVKAENLHYTMRFIGEVGEDGARRIAEAADEAAADCRTFEAEAGEFGAFPSPRRARVLWIGLARGGEELVALATALARALERRGFGKPDQPFAAHLTLGRVRRGTADWSGPLAAAGRPGGPLPRFTVDRLSVVESTLSPQGSIYNLRSAAALAS